MKSKQENWANGYLKTIARFHFYFQIFKSDNMDKVISEALLPAASLSAPIFVAKKYVLLIVSTNPTNHPFIL